MNDEEKFLRDAKAALDAGADGLDGATLSRLRRARAAAVQRATRPPAFGMRLLPAAALASVAAISVAIWFALRPPEEASAPNGLVAAMDDIELIAGEEGPELYDDLDFYRWLAGANHAG